MTEKQTMSGIGRRIYAIIAISVMLILGFLSGELAGNTVLTLIWFIGYVVLAIVSVFRYKNIGYTGYYALVSIFPPIGLVVAAQCFILPAGYATNKSLDISGKIGAFIMVGFVLFFVIGSIGIRGRRE